MCLSVTALFIVVYTFTFNNYELYNLGSIDYTTHSIIQAMGVEREYLPIKTKEHFEDFEYRPYALLALTNNQEATPSATIIKNETPYLLATIENNQNKQTTFELPRLFYAGYELRWKAEGSIKRVTVPYTQSDIGLIETTITDNGTLEVQYTGGKWYPLICLTASVTLICLFTVLYQYSFTKKKIWLEKV